MTMAEVLVLGGGLGGLSVASCLGQRALLLERASQPGGLVRSFEIDGWWFDHVIHLLHFRDDSTKARIRRLLGDVLQPCKPVAYVVCEAGTARFPIQDHLGHLDAATAAACVADLTRESAGPAAQRVANYQELLLRSFGESLCQLFFLPYNAKMWRRDLSTIEHAGMVWNLSRPDPAKVLEGLARPDDSKRAYNEDGWYPRPPAGASQRGMGVLSMALAATVDKLRLNHEVVALSPASRSATVRTPAGLATVGWSVCCVSTLPLSRLVHLCDGVPGDVRAAAGTLEHNRVLSVALRIKGPRPDAGLWRYYPSSEVCFTRLVFLHSFDPLMAPPEGWPLLAEVPWRLDELVPAGLAHCVEAQARAVGALMPEHEVLDATLIEADPAYVVFKHGTEQAVRTVSAWLRSVGIEPLGRYGRWEYSSMAQVMHDGFVLGATLANRLAEAA
jgi:protoporphyrinogen oxidase